MKKQNKIFEYTPYILIGLLILLIALNVYSIINIFFVPKSDIVNVPDVRGKDIITATKLLSENGFRCRIIGVVVDKSKNDIIVVDQNPITRTVKGSIIDLWVSQPAKLVLVPDVKHMNVEDARNLLEKLGLRVEVTPSENGYVVRQVPDSNFFVEKGSNILLWTESSSINTQTPLESTETGTEQTETMTP
ncbi:MAG: ethanolamine transporter [Dictyoglomus sp. NZ13-RE01]|nr:MAG: ethanolamine transporter [Dictyoglomus sp. NZ13-RE01]